MFTIMVCFLLETGPIPVAYNTCFYLQTRIEPLTIMIIYFFNDTRTHTYLEKIS